MIHEREQFEVQSNVGGAKIAMSIDESSMAHIMNVLTDLYSNKKRAIIREYSTNARDAHVEAGVTDPIAVTLPSQLSPFLKIRDFGVGLTVDDVHTIYSQYGASTKRGTNDQNGMLGLGCKSALTYCSQFTVSSVKDGTKIIVNVGRDEDGSGSMTVVDTRSTDEGNGTEVVIPIGRYDMDAIHREAKDFFSVWEPGTVLVNGQPPEHFLTSGPLKLTDSLFIEANRRDSRIVMGNVAYPAPQLDGLVPGVGLLAFVPIGAVNFPPSREALMDTKTTRTTVEKIQADFKTAVSGAVQREVSAAATPTDAVKVVIKWARIIPGSAIQAASYDYKGTKLPASWTVPGLDPNKREYDPTQPFLLASSSNGYNRKGHSEKIRSVPVAQWPTTVWVTDFKPANFNAQHKNKLLKWTAEAGLQVGNGRDVERYVMCPGAGPVSPFIDPLRLVSWEVIRKIQLQPRKTYNGTVRIPGSYDIYTHGGQYQSGVEGDKLDQSQPILYMNGNRWSGGAYTDGLDAILPAYTLVCLSSNRIDKFKRIMPKAITPREAFDKHVKAWTAKLTDDERQALYLNDEGYRGHLTAIDPSKVLDPAVKHAVRIAKIDVSKLVNARRVLSRYTPMSAMTMPLDDPMAAYPLFTGRLLHNHPDHVYAYLNAAYTEGTKVA
jgi:hypothetical protein